MPADFEPGVFVYSRPLDIVVGGGLGAHTAIVLARSDGSVTLYELVKGDRWDVECHVRHDIDTSDPWGDGTTNGRFRIDPPTGMEVQEFESRIEAAAMGQIQQLGDHTDYKLFGGHAYQYAGNCHNFTHDVLHRVDPHLCEQLTDFNPDGANPGLYGRDGQKHPDPQSLDVEPPPREPFDLDEFDDAEIISPRPELPDYTCSPDDTRAEDTTGARFDPDAFDDPDEFGGIVAAHEPDEPSSRPGEPGASNSLDLTAFDDPDPLDCRPDEDPDAGDSFDLDAFDNPEELVCTPDSDAHQLDPSVRFDVEAFDDPNELIDDVDLEPNDSPAAFQIDDFDDFDELCRTDAVDVHFDVGSDFDLDVFHAIEELACTSGSDSAVPVAPDFSDALCTPDMNADWTGGSESFDNYEFINSPIWRHED